MAMLAALAALPLVSGACSGTSDYDRRADATTTIAPTTTTAPAPSTTVPPDAGSEEEASEQPAPAAEPAATAGSFDGAGDSFYPFLGNGGYDVLHYDIALVVEPAEQAVEAVTTITARSAEHLAAFSLDLHGLDVASVTVDGDRAEFSRYGHELSVTLPAPLPPGAEFTTVVDYSGSPGTINDPGVPFLALGWHWTDTASFTASEPLGSMTWFPSNNHPTDKATFEIRVTVPEGLTAASNGVLADEATEAGMTTFTWNMDDPMATYLASVYIGEFERWEHGSDDPDGPLLRDYVAVGYRTAGAGPDVQDALSVTPDVIGYFEELLGPYPFDAYGTIVMPFEIGFALENQTLSLHGIDTLDPMFIIHEVVHHWLGNSATLDDWSETWLHEGFAAYLTFMYQADRDGLDLDATMAWVHEAVADGKASPLMALEHGEMFGLSPYYRGALALHALRLHLGDAPFRETLRAHYEQGAGATTSTAAFLYTAWSVGGDEAVAVLKPWLYDEALPPPPEPGS